MLMDTDSQWLEQKSLSAMCGLISLVCVIKFMKQTNKKKKYNKERRKYFSPLFSAAVIVSFTGTFY